MAELRVDNPAVTGSSPVSTTRRRLLGGISAILAAGVAPAFVRSVMPIRGMIILPGDDEWVDVPLRLPNEVAAIGNKDLASALRVFIVTLSEVDPLYRIRGDTVGIPRSLITDRVEGFVAAKFPDVACARERVLGTVIEDLNLGLAVIEQGSIL